MTAPALPHRPSPADMARRPLPQAPAKQAATRTAANRTSPEGDRPYEPRPLTPEEAIRPGRLFDGERFRAMYQRGLLISGMRPEARLVGHTLLWFANHLTGRISPNWQPSQQQLAEATGLDAARIGVQLEVLVQRGWLHLHRIAEGPRSGRPRFDLTIPALYLEQIRASRGPQKPAN